MEDVNQVSNPTNVSTTPDVPVESTPTSSVQTSSFQQKFEEFAKKRWYLILIIFFLVLIPAFLSTISLPSDSGRYASVGSLTPTEVVTVELQKARDQAKDSAKSYDTQVKDTLTEYPWIRKLPLNGDKYFVYFDMEKKTFVAKLYITPSDDITQLKTMVIQQLKEIGVTVEKYTIEWVQQQ